MYLVGVSEREAMKQKRSVGKEKPSYIMDAREMAEFQGGEKERSAP